MKKTQLILNYIAFIYAIELLINLILILINNINIFDFNYLIVFHTWIIIAIFYSIRIVLMIKYHQGYFLLIKNEVKL
jgi:hypothetical protein